MCAVCNRSMSCDWEKLSSFNAFISLPQWTLHSADSRNTQIELLLNSIIYQIPQMFEITTIETNALRLIPINWWYIYRFFFYFHIVHTFRSDKSTKLMQINSLRVRFVYWICAKMDIVIITERSCHASYDQIHIAYIHFIVCIVIFFRINCVESFANVRE